MWKIKLGASCSFVLAVPQPPSPHIYLWCAALQTPLYNWLIFHESQLAKFHLREWRWPYPAIGFGAKQRCQLVFDNGSIVLQLVSSHQVPTRLLHASVTLARLRKYEEHIIQLKFEWHMGHTLFQFSCDLSTFAMLILCPLLVSQRVGASLLLVVWRMIHGNQCIYSTLFVM